MLKLTPQQVAQVSQLPEQTLRHWRRVLPPLFGLNGYTPCFTPGDALALLVIRHLVKVMGISVGALAPASTALFDICRTTSWPQLAQQRLVIRVERNEAKIVTHDADLMEPAILVPVRPFIEQMQATWASSFPPIDQLPLNFPASVGSPRTRAAGA